jgi:hypothetical protein
MLAEGEGIFTQHTIALECPATFYLFTDGYADQFGGANQKKFMLKNLKQLLLDVQPMKLEQQKQRLDRTIENWKGDVPKPMICSLLGLVFKVYGFQFSVFGSGLIN